jgi:RHS repeat-associated protein
VVSEDPDGDSTRVYFNVRFPGQYFDTETGLHDNRFRTYDPSVGRYISSDPIGQYGGLNLYLYVGASPVNFADPLGLDRVVIVVGDRGLGRHNVGSNFQRAADTAAAAAAAAGDDVTVVNASSASDFNNAINSGPPVDRFEYYGHGWTGVLFPGQNSGPGTNIDPSNLGSLSGANLAPGATGVLNSCRSGTGGDSSIAQGVANQLGVPVTGSTGPMGFSADPSSPPDSTPGAVPPSTGPLYMTPVNGATMQTFAPRP